jgi:hypothetical protein
MSTVEEQADIAWSLSETHYRQFEAFEESPLAVATRAYVDALRDAALNLAESQPTLSPQEFMSAYHDHLTCDLVV